MIVALSLLLFVLFSLGGLAIVRAVLLRLPPEYFSESHSRAFWVDAHPVLRWTGLIVKNIAGAALLVLGVVLTLPGVPGPGVLTILLGIMLMDFPGKRRFERWIIGRPTVFVALNRLRQRYGKPPFTLEG